MADAPTQAKTESATGFETASTATTFFRSRGASSRTRKQKKRDRGQMPYHWEVPSHNEQRRAGTTPPAIPSTRETSVVSFIKKYHPSVKLKLQQRLQTSPKQQQASIGRLKMKKLTMRKRNKKKMAHHQKKMKQAKTTQGMKKSVRKSNAKRRKEKPKTMQKSRKKILQKEGSSKKKWKVKTITRSKLLMVMK